MAKNFISKLLRMVIFWCEPIQTLDQNEQAHQPAKITTIKHGHC